MKLAKISCPLSWRGACLVMVAATFAGADGAHAQSTTTANVSVPNVNLLNLLSPFLDLNATSTGQATLTTNLNSAVAINNNAATSMTIEQTAISDKTIFSSASTSITLANGASAAYGPGANLAGGLPLQAVHNGATPGSINPLQPYGGLGTLGSAYQAAVNPASPAVPGVGTLLTNAYNATSSDLGIAKFYFANGTTNGTTAVVAPAGYTVPTANGFPNRTTSVYDTAYGVSNTGANQDIYGDSRPVQVAPSRINGFDPNALTGLASNPSFPSGHTTYAFTDSILLGMLVPQDYQAMVLRGSEYGNSRIALGVHYPLDIIGSRALASYDLSQSLNATPNYTSLQSQFATAQPALTSYLNAQTASCGGSLQACANSNPYNAYSLSTYGANTPTAAGTLTSNSQIYQARQTYGLPTLSFAATPAEAAPGGGPDASILLATVYGGSTSAAQTVAPNGGISGRLATGTINQIIMNTETNALASFYGTPLSYWTRLDLYDAAGYFQNVGGTLTLAAGDQVLAGIDVGSGGALRGPGASVGTADANNNVGVQSGGLLSPGAVGEAIGGTMTINGAYTQQSGSTFQIQAAGGFAGQYDRLIVNGLASLNGLLDFELIDGFQLPYGLSTFDILDYGSVAGDFAALTFDGMSPCVAGGADAWTCGSSITVNERFTGTALDLQITNVPEPASLAVLASAVAALAWSRRRRPAV